MPHGSCRGVHCLLPCLQINHSHSDDSPQESLVWIGGFLAPESLQLFMVEEGLNPEVVIHPKSLELLGQREVSEDHVVNLGRSKLVFNQKGDQICYDYLLSRRVVPSKSFGNRPSDGVHPTGRLESAAVKHGHVG